MKKLILSFLFLPSLVMGDHCDGGACPALEHFKDTGDEDSQHDEKNAKDQELKNDEKKVETHQIQVFDSD